MNKAVIACKDLHKKYIDGARQVQVLTGVNLAIDSGESVAILGPSGSGKSTLLHLLGGLDTPTSGEVLIAGEKVAEMSEKKRSKLRNQKLGFVYQFHHLLSEFTLLENVAMPLLIRGNKPRQAKASAEHILKRVGLAHRLNHKISQISGGERQRTAVARALVTKPACVLADEPTGNLDHHTAEHLYNVMVDLNQQLNTSLLIVTHDIQLAKKMDRSLILEDGIIHSP